VIQAVERAGIERCIEVVDDFLDEEVRYDLKCNSVTRVALNNWKHVEHERKISF
jgi:hypothetical protein